MSFFKLRSNRANDEHSSTGSSPSQSIESLRRSARHRLIGATVLVLIVVVGFPLLFDTQPRPVNSDIQIQIADKDKVKSTDSPPLVKSKGNASAPASASDKASSSALADKSKDQSGASSGSASGTAAGVVAGAVAHSFSSTMSAITSPAAPNLPTATAVATNNTSNNSSNSSSNNSLTATTTQPKSEGSVTSTIASVAGTGTGTGIASPSTSNGKTSASEPKEEVISTKAPQSKVAALNAGTSGTSGTSASSAATNGSSTQSTNAARDTKENSNSKETKDSKESKDTKETKPIKQIVQIGVYTDTAKIKEYRLKLDKAGFKTTIHSEMGKDGTKRIRIRVVPFKNKDEAQRAIEKIKELKIPGAKLDLIPQP